VVHCRSLSRAFIDRSDSKRAGAHPGTPPKALSQRRQRAQAQHHKKRSAPKRKRQAQPGAISLVATRCRLEHGRPEISQAKRRDDAISEREVTRGALRCDLMLIERHRNTRDRQHRGERRANDRCPYTSRHHPKHCNERNRAHQQPLQHAPRTGLVIEPVLQHPGQAESRDRQPSDQDEKRTGPGRRGAQVSMSFQILRAHALA